MIRISIVVYLIDVIFVFFPNILFKSYFNVIEDKNVQLSIVDITMHKRAIKNKSLIMLGKKLSARKRQGLTLFKVSASISADAQIPIEIERKSKINHNIIEINIQARFNQVDSKEYEQKIPELLLQTHFYF